MALRLPPLASLRLFESAGRHESFKLAAEELHLTPSAVSHGVVMLERWLGVTLFERRSNGVTLTKEGSDYLPFVSEALATIAVGTRRLPNTGSVRRVSISAAPTFASWWLLPRLVDFRDRHPDILLTIDTSHRQVGFPVDNVDLAIRMARSPWPGLPSTFLFAEELVPVCSPDFMNRHKKNGELDLATVPLLHLVSVTEDWAAWIDQTGHADLDLTTGLNFDTVHMAIDAAIAGLGVALGRRPLVDRDLASGRLVQAASPAAQATAGFWLVEAREADARREVRTFVTWLIEVSKSG
ncbi:MAG: transcriptional regulator GcvA [Rhodobacteraceae bacterium]|nr:transcriptional regulator GcvA [Paracoccaceae bacterium]